MKTSPEASIAAPVRNCEKYLVECLDALAGQSLENLEFLLVDDGSDDNTPEICFERAKADSRFKFFRRPRSGQGAARNFAIKRALAPCIGFTDGDDAPDRDMFEKLLGAMRAHNADLAVCLLRTVRRKRHAVSGAPPTRELDGNSTLAEYLANPRFGAFSCNKLFSRSALEKAGPYPEGMLYEDVAYIPFACASAGKTVFIGEELYYYRQHPESVTRSAFNPGKLDMLKACSILYERLSAYRPEFAAAAAEKMFFEVMGIFNTLCRADRDFVPDYDNTLKMITEKALFFRRLFDFAGASRKKRLALCDFMLAHPDISAFALKFRRNNSFHG